MNSFKGFLIQMCSPRKYPYFLQSEDWIFLGERGFCKAKKFKEMLQAYLEFPEGNVCGGGGGLRKNPFRRGGMDVFWNYTMPISMILPKCHKGDFGSHNLFKRIKRVISV